MKYRQRMNYTPDGEWVARQRIFNDVRTPPVSNVRVHDNTLNRDVLNSCNNAGVGCTATVS
jgi:hypothetical protein